jgi:hypothetical protein
VNCTRLAWLGLLLGLGAQAADRVALLVSNDIGLSEDPALHYTASDADRVAAVLIELGQFAPADVHRVSDKNAAELLSALDQLALAKGSAQTFFFYYSGHADASALHMAGSNLPFETLLQHVKAIRSELHISILDACQSGGAARPKGVRAGPAFDVQIDGRSPEGNILISSSAVDEQSYESDETRGAVFTVHWTSGLRGAADRDGDNQVTLGEAYGYAYSQTLRSTLLSRTGPQHPSYQWDFTGRQDPVLTVLSSSARLTVSSDDDASFIVFDAQERAVITELSVPANDRRRLALAPGEYVVKKHGTKGLSVARVELGKNDDRVLDSNQMRTVPFVRLARKGALANAWLTADIGQYSSALGPSLHPHVSLGLEWEKGRWLLFGEVLFSRGTEEHDGLTTTDTLVGPVAGALWSKSIGEVLVLRGGPAAGVLYLQQISSDRNRADAVGVLLGARLRADLQLGERVGLLAAVDLMAEGAPISGPPPALSIKLGGFGVMAFISYSVGARVSW